MRAMVLDRPGRRLRVADLPVPRPGPGQVLLRVRACGICRTDLHVVDGELTSPTLPLIPGHEIVGEVVTAAANVDLAVGALVGVPWLGFTCGNCIYCRRGRENLCVAARFTGYQLDGGYAEATVADARYCLPLPSGQPPRAVAPWLCAGLIGYRCLRMVGDARRLGLYGFGAAAHIVAQIARHQGREVFAFVRPGDLAGESFARELGAAWTGPSDTAPPTELDAAIIFAPVGSLVPRALAAVGPGGVVVCGGIHMSDIPSFPYALLWGERTVCSVANLTRKDGLEFLALAPTVPVHCAVQPYPLTSANDALDDLRHGRVRGAAVLEP
jgi:propanol-preferring alcohol dehydrogenase